MPAPPLHNFVDKVSVVDTPWLNAVDVTVTTVFEQASTKPTARTALTNDAPFEIANGGTGGRAGTNLVLQGTDSGGTNAYVVTLLSTGVVSLTTGIAVKFTANGSNTGPSTVNVGGSGAVAIVNAFGAALAGGEITATGQTWIQYTGTVWQLVGRGVTDASYVRTAAEITAGVTPTNFAYPPGHVWRYGATGNGVTDDSVAFANAALVSGTYPMQIPFTTGGYKISTPFVLPATGATIRGLGRPTLFATVNGTHIFSCVGGTEITVEGIIGNGTGSATTPLNAFGGYATFVTGLFTLVNCTNVRMNDCEASNFYNGITIQQCTTVKTRGNKVSHWLASGYQWGCNVDTESICDTADGSDQNGGVVSYCVQATGNSAGGFPTRNNKWIAPTWHNCPSWDGIGSHDYDGFHIIAPDIRNVRQGIDLGHFNSSNTCKNATLNGGYILGTSTDTWAGVSAQTGGVLIEGFDATHRVDGTTVNGLIIDGFFGVAGMVGGGIPSNITVSNADNTSINSPVVKNAGSVVSNGGIFLNGTINQFSATGGTLQGKMVLGGVRFNNVIGNVTSVTGVTIVQNTATDNALVATGSTLSAHLWSGNPTNSTNPIFISTSTITYAPGGSIRGNQALAGVTAQAVAFPNGQQMPSSTYEVALSQSATSTSPPWVTSKSATGFTINFSVNFTGNVDWVVSA